MHFRDQSVEPFFVKTFVDVCMGNVHFRSGCCVYNNNKNNKDKTESMERKFMSVCVKAS